MDIFKHACTILKEYDFAGDVADINRAKYAFKMCICDVK